MDKEKDTQLENNSPEEILEFKDAQEMTVGDVVRKESDLKAGITEDDGLLDRYIKQHREKIEADKFETKQFKTSEISAAAAASETVANPSESVATEELVDTPVKKPRNPLIAPVVPVAKSSSVASADTKVPAEPSPSSSYDYDSDTDELSDEEETKARRKKWLAALLALLALLGIAWTAYSQRDAIASLFGQSANTSKSNDATKDSDASDSSNSKESQKATETPAADTAKVKAFDDLYAGFFTDSSKTNLKNDSFDSLSELETALSALEGTAEYDAAKEKYDQLKEAIQATQAINSQFDKPVLVDGEIDTSATAVAGSDFTAPATGLSTVDAALAAAVNFGRSQLTAGSTNPATPVAPAAPANQTAEAAPAVPSAPAQNSTAASNPVTLNNGIVLDYGKRIVFGSDQVKLQRDVTRVPYNDDLIADASNEAWVFGPGILEKIIATSNQRGYYAGNDFILEKVNIINGNGYYNMFKTDGTYLFSINAKTGYFFGNASGRKADY